MNILPACALLLAQLAACAPGPEGRPAGESTAADSLQREAAEAYADEPRPRRAARWYLLRAAEERESGFFEAAQQDLDRTFRILSQFEDDELGDATALRAAVEKAYFALLPHLESFSPDSPLVLLLEGLSEEKIEQLPPDAAPIVRIHQLSRQCDVPIDANSTVAASIHFFQTRGRQTYLAWLKRSGRYRDLINEILHAEGLPRDLFYLAMIESGFEPRAYSRAHAVGLWQFMAGTARLEGLVRNHWVDERRDPLKSTRAAARYLKKLYEEFGDWRLAAAAYNAGRGRVRRALEEAQTSDFWRLDLPRETRNYVPLFMAAALIAKDPALFGFGAPAIDPPLHCESLTLPYPVQLKDAARCMGITRATLRQLNPELRRGVTPVYAGKNYSLWIPPGKGQSLLKCRHLEQIAWYNYKVQPRDTLSEIARAFAVAVGALADANGIADLNHIYPGQTLYIPAASGGARHLYTVRRGDSLDRIARAHGVEVAELKKWNGLEGDLIRPHQKLYIARPKVEASPQKKGEYYTVRSNDTLWEIARRFELSVAELKKWNGLEGTLIRPGQKLRLSASGGARVHLYTVVEGDTLYGIARRFGLDAGELARQNNISPATTLLTGTLLKIKTRERVD